MDLVVEKGTIVTASQVYQADVGIEDGTIVAIGKGFSGRERIRARGKYVLPGAIDVHVHMELPVLGTFSSDDFESGSIAAAYGGTTTIIDFADQERGVSLEEALRRRLEVAGKSAIDYGLHMAISEVNDDVLASQMPGMVEKGISSFKFYLAYPDRYMVDDESLYRALLRAGELGGLVMVHAENGQMIDNLTRRFLAEGKREPIWGTRAHPPEAEDEATGRAIALAGRAGAPIYIVHLTTAAALKRVLEARGEAKPVFAETCPQYLLLTEEEYKRPGFEAAKYLTSPPLRDKASQEALWNALAKGQVQVVSTDHCPFTMKQRERGRDDFSKIPNGLPGVETRVPLLYHFGVNQGRLSLNQFVDTVATSPARLFGLLPRKGTIAVGSDADLVIFDPRKETPLTLNNLHMRVDYSPYEHITVRGYPTLVMQRGKILVEEGRFHGCRGDGVFLKRKPLSV
jgi:dihydropyrimidinase